MANTKNSQLIAYIAKTHQAASVTVLMKLSYLIDLVAIKKLGQTISEFEYRRYNFGPFDNRIYKVIESLVTEKVLGQNSDYSSMGSEYIVYSFNGENTEYSFEKLSAQETGLISDVVKSLRGYGAKTLTEIAYQTKPMLALGATLGGDENLNAKIDLTVA